MLRLPQLELQRPTSVAEAVELLAQHGASAAVLAGGTDLVPNLKHGLYDVDVLVSLGAIEELRGIHQADDGGLVIGAMTPLASVADAEDVRAAAPALAQAAGLVAGPQQRIMGTLGGNVMLDTRCQWINQSHFWRQALGYCLKKDGTACHVVAGGKKCVAAASNDTAPVLMTLGAQVVFVGPEGTRVLPIDELWKADGIHNKQNRPGELLTEVRIPARGAGRQGFVHKGAYGKLRDRDSIDFPLLGVAVRLDLDENGAVDDADIVVVALQARPTRVKKVAELLTGLTPGTQTFEDAAREVARRAHKQCTPLHNIPGDPEYRKRMVPVYVRRTLLAAAAQTSN